MNTASNKLESSRGEQVLSHVADVLTQLLAKSLGSGRRIETDEILRAVTKAIADRLPVTVMAILMKPDPDTSRIIFADNHNPEFVGWLEAYVASLLRPHEAPTAGVSRKVIETGGPILIPRMNVEVLKSMTSDTARRFWDEHPIPAPSEDLAWMMVPMRSGPAIVGTLAIADWGCRLLNDFDLDWMQRAGDRVGITIDNAQMRNKSVERSERLAAMSEVALAITSSHDCALSFKLILERVTASPRADAADIVLVDEDGGHMFVAAAGGFRSRLVGEVRTQVPTAAGMRWIAEHDVAPVSTLEWLGQSRRWMLAREGLTSCTAAPLVLDDRFVGALEVFSRLEMESDPEWLGFLDAMAVHAAIALDNSRLHDSLRQRAPSAAFRPLSPMPSLSEREMQILRMVVEGASNREVAEKLHLSENTIKFHVRQLLEKTDVANRTELATRAVHQGWV